MKIVKYLVGLTTYLAIFGSIANSCQMRRTIGETALVDCPSTTTTSVSLCECFQDL